MVGSSLRGESKKTGCTIWHGPRYICTYINPVSKGGDLSDQSRRHAPAATPRISRPSRLKPIYPEALRRWPCSDMYYSNVAFKSPETLKGPGTSGERCLRPFSFLTSPPNHPAPVLGRKRQNYEIVDRPAQGSKSYKGCPHDDRSDDSPTDREYFKVL